MRLFDFLFVVTIVIWVVGLAAAGYLTPEQAGLALVALVVLRAMARAMRIRMARLVFAIALPVASFLILVGVQTGGSLGAWADLAAALGVLVIVLCGLYVIVANVFFRRRRSDH